MLEDDYDYDMARSEEAQEMEEMFSAMTDEEKIDYVEKFWENQYPKTVHSSFWD